MPLVLPSPVRHVCPEINLVRVALQGVGKPLQQLVWILPIPDRMDDVGFQPTGVLSRDDLDRDDEATGRGRGTQISNVSTLPTLPGDPQQR